MAKSYKDKARQLKAAGLIDIDLRRTLTPSQKGAITRAHNKHKGILENLQDFATAIVSVNTAKNIDADAMRVKTKSGKVKIFVRKETDDEKLRIKKGRVVRQSRKYSEEIYPGGWRFFESAQKVFKRKLQRGEYVTVSIGENRPFKRGFYDLNSMLNYMGEWSPKDAKNPYEAQQLKEKLIGKISIVRIFDPLDVVKGANGGKKKGRKKVSRN